MKNSIIIGKTESTHKIHDLDMRYIKITCFSFVIVNEIEIIQYKNYETSIN